MHQFPALVILGARQTGKTTLSKHIAPEFDYFDLEQPSQQARITQDPGLFFSQYESNLILDEAQIAPEIFDVLRGVIDEKRHQSGRFIITGSSSPMLKQRVSESLAGRVALIELGTLKATESAQQPVSPIYQAIHTGMFKTYPKPAAFEAWPKLTTQQLHRSWFIGGYPDVVLGQDQTFINRWFGFYEEAYINRDIALLFPGLNKQAYQRFLRMLCHLSGTILNKSAVARDLEISESSVRQYIEIAAGTYLWHQLPSFDGNQRKAVVKMPKGHIRDSGLLHHLLRIPNLEALYEHPIVGHSFESFVIEEMLKGMSLECISFDTYYYRTRAGAEIDLVLEGPFGLLPIEVKYGSHTPLKKLASLTQFIKEYNLPYGILINQAPDIAWLTPNIIQIPVNYL